MHKHISVSLEASIRKDGTCAGLAAVHGHSSGTQRHLADLHIFVIFWLVVTFS